MVVTVVVLAAVVVVVATEAAAAAAAAAAAITYAKVKPVFKKKKILKSHFNCSKKNCILHLAFFCFQMLG